MPSRDPLDHDSDASTVRPSGSGRAGTASDVAREALSMLQERERRLEALDTAIARGLADLKAGSPQIADVVFDEPNAAALPPSSP